VVPNSLIFNAASALTAVGIVLVLANWYAKPEAALAWTAALAMCVVMVAALRVSRRAVRHSTAKATAVPGLDRIPTAVVFAALMMGIPLALTLARSYGLVDGSDVARRSTGVLTGAFLAMLGNVMPKNLPPSSSMRCDGARQQAFHRRAGWTWVLCGLASAIGWLALPIDSAEIAAIVLVVTAMVVTIVHLLRLSRQRKEQPASGLN
jgi:hypothetical protein